MRVSAEFSMNPPAKFIGFERPWSVILALCWPWRRWRWEILQRWRRPVFARLLAYSAIAHAGYILLALAYFSHSPLSTNAILYYILTYGLTTIGAFGAVAVVERASGSDRMDAFLGLSKRTRCWQRF